jgi:hypothetical protein
MAQRGEAAEGANQSENPGRDPLASPTLAALYASQGHADVAEVIYSQLGRRSGGPAAPPAGKATPTRGTRDTLLLQRLLALREAARRIRETGMPRAGEETGHGR